MKALAPKPPAKAHERDVARRESREAPLHAERSAPFAPAALRAGARGNGCACGGGCPRCASSEASGAHEHSDVPERQADDVAERVMRMPAHEHAGPAPSPPNDVRTAASTAPAIVQEVLRSAGQPLDAATRAFMEPRFGHDFSGVRVHTDAKAAESARAIGASAYTVGREIVFGAGQYAPAKTEGQRLIAHELTHTLQQTNATGSLTRVNPGSLQRKCSEHAEKEFYESAPNYCKDDASTGQLHGGHTCFREFPLSRADFKDCPPGDHVCFDQHGKCEDHVDKVSPVASKKADGTCKLHAQCSIEHFFKDKVLDAWLRKKGFEPYPEVRLPGEGEPRGWW